MTSTIIKNELSPSEEAPVSNHSLLNLSDAPQDESITEESPIPSKNANGSIEINQSFTEASTNGHHTLNRRRSSLSSVKDGGVLKKEKSIKRKRSQGSTTTTALTGGATTTTQGGSNRTQMRDNQKKIGSGFKRPRSVLHEVSHEEVVACSAECVAQLKENTNRLNDLKMKTRTFMDACIQEVFSDILTEIELLMSPILMEQQPHHLHGDDDDDQPPIESSGGDTERTPMDQNNTTTTKKSKQTPTTSKHHRLRNGKESLQKDLLTPLEDKMRTLETLQRSIADHCKETDRSIDSMMQKFEHMNNSFWIIYRRMVASFHSAVLRQRFYGPFQEYLPVPNTEVQMQELLSLTAKNKELKDLPPLRKLFDDSITKYPFTVC